MNNHIYKKIPTKIEAFELKRGILPEWFINNKQIKQISFSNTEGLEVEINTFLGYETLREGDYVIKESDYIYGCPKILFEEKYEKVEE